MHHRRVSSVLDGAQSDEAAWDGLSQINSDRQDYRSGARRVRIPEKRKADSCRDPTSDARGGSDDATPVTGRARSEELSPFRRASATSLRQFSPYRAFASPTETKRSISVQRKLLPAPAYRPRVSDAAATRVPARLVLLLRDDAFVPVLVSFATGSRYRFAPKPRQCITVRSMVLTSNQLQYVKNQISRGQMILFAGAGFSRDARNALGQPLPGTQELAKLLFDLLYPGDAFEDDAQLGELYAVAVKRDPRGAERLLATHLAIDPSSLSEYYSTYFRFPWLRIYTLNVDELEQAAAQRFELPRQPTSLSALEHDSPQGRVQDPADVLEVVHLNGRITDSLDAMTFSESQYGERLASQEPWYIRCATDIKTRPILFVGTTLQESLFWQHLAIRRRDRPKGGHVPPPASILVSPQLSRVRAEMLQELNVLWYKGTADSFNSDVLGVCAAEKTMRQS